MKLANVVTKTVAMLVLVAVCLIPLAAQATFWSYDFTFYDTIGQDIERPPRAKSDNDTNWWIRIYDNGINTLSSTNILGVRMNFSLCAYRLNSATTPNNRNYPIYWTLNAIY